MFAAGSIDLLFLDRLCSWQWQRAGTVSSTRWQMSSLKVMSYLRWKGTRPISRVDEEKSPFHHFNIHTITITAIPWRSERVEAVGFQSFLYEQRVRICFQSHQNNRSQWRIRMKWSMSFCAAFVPPERGDVTSVWEFVIWIVYLINIYKMLPSKVHNVTY